MKNLPKVVHSGKFKLGDYEIEVCNLDNGQRVVTEEGVKNFMEWLSNGGKPDDKQVMEFAKALKGIK